MAAEVEFRFPARGSGNRFLVPMSAVGQDREGRFVFVVEPSGEGLGVARRREVRVGEITAQGLEILDGLSDGDLLVTAGVTKLQEGRKVRILDSP
jgi:multidrug efflux pump subunit AcrA (membrane-fusion protein)